MSDFLQKSRWRWESAQAGRGASRRRAALGAAALATLSALLTLVPQLEAAVPHLINYQGFLTDENGDPVNGPVTLAFAVFPDSAAGLPVWGPSQYDGVNVVEGVFHVILGAATPLPQSLFTGSILWLETRVNGTPVLPRRKLVSVPYSLRAAVADSLAAPTGDWSADGDNIYRLLGNVGIGTATPDQKLTVQGTIRATDRVMASVVEITGGSDLAEPFLIASEEAVPPGTVLIIDDRTPGRLRMSDRPYDVRVAGVVSGAGDLNPGLILSQPGVADGGAKVALSGRVYVLAEALSAPIHPGDLLTTSATPGHAMKATDPARSAGAILGKAMSSLESGQGLVLVLVSLQ
jgi:hypothetical protein